MSRPRRAGPGRGVRAKRRIDRRRGDVGARGARDRVGGDLGLLCSQSALLEGDGGRIACAIGAGHTTDRAGRVDRDEAVAIMGEATQARADEQGQCDHTIGAREDVSSQIEQAVPVEALNGQPGPQSHPCRSERCGNRVAA